MWFRKNRKNNEPTKNHFHGVDLNVWDYLGSTTIKWDSIPVDVYFFNTKGTGEERKYVLAGGHRTLLKEILEFHSFVYHTCELWRIGEHKLCAVINSPSETLKKLTFERYGWVWNKGKNWWVHASENDKYEYEVSKKTPKAIVTDNNIIKVDFKEKE